MDQKGIGCQTWGSSSLSPLPKSPNNTPNRHSRSPRSAWFPMGCPRTSRARLSPLSRWSKQKPSTPATFSEGGRVPGGHASSPTSSPGAVRGSQDRTLRMDGAAPLLPPVLPSDMGTHSVGLGSFITCQSRASAQLIAMSKPSRAWTLSPPL